MKKLERIWQILFVIATLCLVFLLSFQSLSEYKKISQLHYYQDSIQLLNTQILELETIIKNERDNYNNYFINDNTDSCCSN